jgi:hypothetical protein
MGDVATLLFVHFNFIIQFRNIVCIPEINPHCILSQIYALFIEFYYALIFFFFLNLSLFWSLHLSEVILWCWNCMNDLKKSDLKMLSLNVRTTYHIYYFTFKYYFFKVNTNISTSFRQSMLISFWIDMVSICTLSMS